MDHLVIVGAGSLAREVLGWLPGFEGIGTNFQLRGLLTDTHESLTKLGYEEPILGNVADYTIQPDDLFFIAIADCAARLRYSRELSARGARFQSLIHRTAIRSRGVQIGAGTLICPYAIVSCDATIGNHVVLNCSSGVGHDAVIGDGCTFSSYSEITGYVSLGTGVFLGSHATILPNVKVGDFAVIGAGSAVIRNVAANTTMVGVPAKKLLSSSNDNSAET